MACKKVIENFLENFFRRLGSLIGRFPMLVILGSLLITGLLSLGLFSFEEVNNVRTEYSPTNSPSRKEYEVAKEFLNQNGTLDPSYVMLMAKDGGNLLRAEYRKKIIGFVKTLQNNVTVEFDGRVWDFRDLCEPYCELNTAFLAFIKLYNESIPSTYTYPRVDIFGTQAFIGNNVYGVTLGDDGHAIESFTTAILPFYLVASYESSGVIFAWLQAARESFREPQFEMFSIEATGDSLVSAEVRRMGFQTAPLIAASVALIVVFVVAFSFRQDSVRSKPWESFIGCMIPLLALVASTGLLSFFGFKFQSIIVAALFLVLSVGVDDVFIILRAWDRTTALQDIEDRMAKTLEEAGPSITISSLTNAMSFFIGMTSQTPAVHSFSLFSAVAILVCYVYQMVVFSAVLGISGRREKAGRSSLFCCFKSPPNARCELVRRVVEVQIAVIRKFSNVIATWPARAVLVLIMCGYYYMSFVGICNVKTLITIEKMALPDSYLQKFQQQFETSLKNMQPISIFVLNPGDLRQPERLQTVKDMVKDFENATYSYGSNSTFFWLQPYEDFLLFYGESEEFTYAEIPTFFKSATYFYLTSFVKYNESACLDNDPNCISSFFFMTNFHQHIKYHELIPAVEDWRRIAEKYAEYQVYAYSDHSPFVDQTMAIDSTVWSSVGAALGCTAIACFIFIPNMACIVASCFSVLSITVGIIGFLSIWDVDLDPLSMAALLMAIGFSVDFSSHIAYHFYKSNESDPVLRIEDTLTCIGWPLMQVGLSTIVAVAPLLFKQSYLAMVFLKTIVVVVILGMFHGLVVLPAVLVAVAPKTPEEACAAPALKHNIALGRTLSSQ